ncbi:MLP-like protein 34 [Vitis vinifera]|nr:MLP-like protein 34 [Vitis vinifera]
MAQIDKMETHVEKKSPANEFYEVFSSKAHLIPKACPDKIKSIEVVEGDWKSVGSVKLWTYCIGGNTSSSKERVEKKDDKNKSITFKALDGEVMKDFKSVISILEVSAKDDGSLVKWTLEYEKSNEKLLPPDAYLSLVISMSKEIDAYLLKLGTWFSNTTKIMAQIAKMEVQAEIKSPASKFHEVCSRKVYLVPKACPEKIKSIEVVEGDWKTVGSVQLWTYFIGGNTEEAKLVVERVDEENKTVTMNVVEGDIVKYFKIFKCTIQVTVKDKGSLVTWSVEYEKLNESGPAPDAYLNFAMGIVENVDAYLLKA